MKNNTYFDAVEHLEFSDTLCEKVVEKAGKPRSGYRMIRIAAVAAIMVCLLATSAFAVSPEFRDWTISILRLGISREEMTDAVKMEFRHEEADGYSIHYLELDKENYSFVHSMLISPQTGYLYITDDYQLEPVELKTLPITLEKHGRTYKRSRPFSFIETEKGVISSQKNVLQKNESGEVFMNVTDGKSNQWPVYVNLETGAVRDALPGWTEDDFNGRIGYAYELWGGILVGTLADEFKIVDGNSAAYNLYYWIGEGAEDAVLIELPEDEYGTFCENNEFYCKNIHGHLFRLNRDFEFELLYEYETGDDLTNGLYTVATADGELAIIDVYRNETYVIPAVTVDPGKADGSGGRTGWEIDETMGYNATRYNEEGRIALVQKDWIPEEFRVALLKLGILDEETGELRMLEIENKYDGYQTYWLDENRLATMYDDRYLCIYEFE